MGGGFGIPGLGMILFWVPIVGVIVLLVRGFSASGSSTGDKSARQRLDERFARGEIDRDEYEEKRRLLADQ